MGHIMDPWVPMDAKQTQNHGFLNKYFLSGLQQLLEIPSFLTTLRPAAGTSVGVNKLIPNDQGWEEDSLLGGLRKLSLKSVSHQTL